VNWKRSVAGGEAQTWFQKWNKNEVYSNLENTFSKFIPALGPIQPSIQWVGGHIPQG